MILCVNCGCETKNVKFCSHSCSATHNNKGIVRNGVKNERICIHCNTPLSRYDTKYCSNKCQQDYLYGIKIKQKIEEFNSGLLKRRDWIYEILVTRDGNHCSQCGIHNWNNKPIRLWVDHIDGNASNNSPKNFRLICPNCDSQSPTFGAKNKSKGRRSLGLKPYD